MVTWERVRSEPTLSSCGKRDGHGEGWGLRSDECHFESGQKFRGAVARNIEQGKHNRGLHDRGTGSHGQRRPDGGGYT